MSYFGTKDPFIEQAVRVVKSTYGDNISVEAKKKDLIKFGRNPDVTNAVTGSTIMHFVGGADHETYVSSNVIDTISSSSGSDTQDIKVEGHTISGSDLTFVVQTATLNGQSQVTLTTPLARCTRLYNNSGTVLDGAVYAYQSGITVSAGVPQDGTKTHCIIPDGRDQSEKCSTSISSQDYWLITSFTASVLEKTSVFAEVELQVRESGGVFRSKDVASVTSGETYSETYNPYLIVPKNSDVRLVAVGSSNSIDVAGSIHGMLASVV